MTTNAASQRPLLTVFDVADLLAVAEDTVRRWEREGKLRGLRPAGHSVRFDPADVEALIAAGARGGKGASRR